MSATHVGGTGVCKFLESRSGAPFGGGGLERPCFGGARKLSREGLE